MLLLVSNHDVDLVTDGMDSSAPYRFLPVLLEPGPQAHPRLARLHCLHLGRAAESARAWRVGLASVLRSLPPIEIDLGKNISLIGTRWVSGLFLESSSRWDPMVFELRADQILAFSNATNRWRWTEPRRWVDEPFHTERQHHEEPFNLEASWRCFGGFVFFRITSSIAPFPYMMFTGRLSAPKAKSIVGFWQVPVAVKSGPGALLRACHTTVSDLLDDGTNRLLAGWIEEALNGESLTGLPLPASDRGVSAVLSWTQEERKALEQAVEAVERIHAGR